MTRSLTELLEMVKNVAMSPDDLELQRRSFAWGNTHLENPNVTKLMVDRAADQIPRR